MSSNENTIVMNGTRGEREVKVIRRRTFAVRVDNPEAAIAVTKQPEPEVIKTTIQPESIKEPVDDYAEFEAAVASSIASFKEENPRHNRKQDRRYNADHDGDYPRGRKGSKGYKRDRNKNWS